jgi:hypothetical protein
MQTIIPIISILCVFVGAPAIVFGFILMNMRGKREIEKLRLQKDILALDVERERTKLLAMEAEGRKYDRIIEDHGRK